MTDFATDPVTLGNGVTGTIHRIRSGNPANFYQAISQTAEVPQQDIFGQLFLPSDPGEALVIIVPGSLGVAVSHLAHATTLVEEGLAALVIDPFGSRQVTSTVANQAQYSFAASAWDVIAATAQMRTEGFKRVGAQGHSRGGTAVLGAASSVLINAMAGTPLDAVYAAYPWCGMQFSHPDVGKTRVRSIIGDQDEWCLPQQVQSAMHAIRLTGGDASCRIVPNAQHSFDRESPVELISDASVAPAAPTIYLADDGRYLHPVSGECEPDTMERDLMLYGIRAGYGVRGARIGSDGDQPALFRQDMLDFWRSSLD